MWGGSSQSQNTTGAPLPPDCRTATLRAQARAYVCRYRMLSDGERGQVEPQCAVTDGASARVPRHSPRAAVARHTVVWVEEGRRPPVRQSSLLCRHRLPPPRGRSRRTSHNKKAPSRTVGIVWLYSNSRLPHCGRIDETGSATPPALTALAIAGVSVLIAVLPAFYLLYVLFSHPSPEVTE